MRQDSHDETTAILTGGFAPPPAILALPFWHVNLACHFGTAILALPFWQPLEPAFLVPYYVGALIFQNFFGLTFRANPLGLSGANVSVPSGVTFFTERHNIVKP